MKWVKCSSSSLEAKARCSYLCWSEILWHRWHYFGRWWVCTSYGWCSGWCSSRAVYSCMGWSCSRMYMDTSKSHTDDRDSDGGYCFAAAVTQENCWESLQMTGAEQPHNLYEALVNVNVFRYWWCIQEPEYEEVKELNRTGLVAFWCWLILKCSNKSRLTHSHTLQLVGMMLRSIGLVNSCLL